MSAQHAVKVDKVWSWSDYRCWPDDERWEIVGGIAYAMAPAPSIAHQGVTLRIAARLERALRGKPCRPFVAPTDVKLSEFDVVQPDILVVCDPGKIAADCIDGAPDVVFEVLSPRTASRDLREKKFLYASFGVGEYIVVDPLEHYAISFMLEGAAYNVGTVFGAQENLRIATLDSLELPLWEVFELPEPTDNPSDK